MVLQQPVCVGVVFGVHGTDGTLRVDPMTDVADRFDKGSVMYLSTLDGRKLTVISARPHKGALLVKFDPVSDRTEAQELRGVQLVVNSDQVPEPPQGQVWLFSLMGKTVMDESGCVLGEVSGHVESAGGGLIEVDGPNGSFYIPAAADMLTKVDDENGIVYVNLPDGLISSQSVSKHGGAV